MFHWVLETRHRALELGRGEQGLNVAEDLRELVDALNEPIPGVTRDDRYDEVESESFANFAAAMGG